MKTAKAWAPEMVERFRLGFNCLEVDLEEVMEVLAKEIQQDAYLSGLRKADSYYVPDGNPVNWTIKIQNEISRVEKEGAV